MARDSYNNATRSRLMISTFSVFTGTPIIVLYGTGAIFFFSSPINL
jgi:hypothetical protein